MFVVTYIYVYVSLFLESNIFCYWWSYVVQRLYNQIRFDDHIFHRWQLIFYTKCLNSSPKIGPMGGCIEIFYHRLSYSYFLMASITNQMIKGQSILYKNMYMYLHMHRFQLYSIGTCISTSLRAESWKRNVPTVFVLFIWMLWYYWGCDWFSENFTTSIILIVLLLSALHVYQTQTPILR